MEAELRSLITVHFSHWVFKEEELLHIRRPDEEQTVLDHVLRCETGISTILSRLDNIDVAMVNLSSKIEKLEKKSVM